MPGLRITTLADMPENEEVDVFALLSVKERFLTRDNKPYYRVTFRDVTGEITFPIWHNTLWSVPCETEWRMGVVYKIRAVRVISSQYGSQLKIHKIREAIPEDAPDGYSPNMMNPSSEHFPEQMFCDLKALARKNILNQKLRRVVLFMMEKYRCALLESSASRGKHHAVTGGLLEHTLNVTQIAVQLGTHYTHLYAQMNPPLNMSVLTASAILHDFGKLLEIQATPSGFLHTASGGLLGHLVLGRDLFRDAVRLIEEDATLGLDLINESEDLKSTTQKIESEHSVEHPLQKSAECAVTESKKGKKKNQPERSEQNIRPGGKNISTEENHFSSELSEEARPGAPELQVQSDLEVMLRVEHAILAHEPQDWGAPEPPRTPEALLVHYADAIDIHFNIMAHALDDEKKVGNFTDQRNPLKMFFYRGGE